ncbi:MAG: YbaB/EbfC family nucleoid-associated protein [Candidatus Aminicenantes bacterium]|nr:YbaB/EbfC family nucleoid-associated protein [Candidatus Aminicenantes bacterium]
MKGFGDIQKMLKSAKEMQERLQRETAEMRMEGSAGGGMVTVVMDGQKSVLSLKLDPEVVDRDDVDMLQDLILAAIRDAAAKVDAELASKLGGLGAGLKIPGMF